jgi:hypothetical protein
VGNAGALSVKSTGRHGVEAVHAVGHVILFEFAGSVIKSEAAGAVEQAVAAVGIMVDAHPGALVVGSDGAFRDLPPAPSVVDGVVIADNPLLLNAQDVRATKAEPSCSAAWAKWALCAGR